MPAGPRSTTGRPRRFDQGEILDAALDLFWREGFRATTTRKLESGLGMSQSSLYNAFGSKAGLLSAALDRYEARVDEVVVQPLEQAVDGLAAIERFVDDLTRWVTDEDRRGCMVINLMGEDGGASPELTERTGRYRERVRLVLRDAVARAASRGETSGEAIRERADTVYGLVLGLNVAARGGAHPEELDALRRAARHVIAGWRTV